MVTIAVETGMLSDTRLYYLISSVHSKADIFISFMYCLWFNLYVSLNYNSKNKILKWENLVNVLIVC